MPELQASVVLDLTCPQCEHPQARLAVSRPFHGRTPPALVLSQYELANVEVACARCRSSMRFAGVQFELGVVGEDEAPRVHHLRAANDVEGDEA